MKPSVKIYGAFAEAVEQGQQFIATKFTVEGRTIVELRPIEKVYS